MKTCRIHPLPRSLRNVFLPLLLIACVSGMAIAGTKTEHLYLLAGTPTIYSPQGFPVRLYGVADGRLVLVRQIATGLFSVANDLSGHLYVIPLSRRAISVIHENAPGEIDVVPAPSGGTGRIARFSFYDPTWGAVAGPGVTPSAVFVDLVTGHWIVTRIYAHAPRGKPRISRGSWYLYRYFRYAGNGGGPFQQIVPAGVIVGDRLGMVRGSSPGSCMGVLEPTPPFLPLDARALSDTTDGSTSQDTVRGANIVADTARFFAFNAPLPNSELRSPRTVYVLNKTTRHWSVVKVPFDDYWPRLFGAWLVTTVQEPNPEGRKSPGLENERAHEVDVDTPTGKVRELPRIRGMYSSKVLMPGKLLLQNLLDGRKLTIDTGQQDGDVLDIRKDGLVLYRVNDEIFSGQIAGNKLSAPKLVVKGEDVPEVHWVFWSKAATEPHALAERAPHQKKPFTLTLAAPKQPLKAGTELVLNATIENTSGHDMEFPTSLGRIPPDGFRYKIEVLYDHGRPAPHAVRVLERRRLESKAKEERKPLLPMGWSNTVRRLKPGESFVDEINVSQCYSLSRPGLYAIWLIRLLPPDLVGTTPRKFWKGSVRSNTITVTVTK